MRLVRPFLVCVLLTSALFAQNNSSDDQPATVIHSNPRLVLVNVIVSGPDGKPVHGLSQHDFTVFEDGKSQSIRSFEEHGSAASTDPAPTKEAKLDLGPNVHTNFVPVAKNQVTNILLFDMLNMSSQDLASAKAELVNTLQHLPEGQQFALFVMGMQLHMIQGFTWDKNAMLNAANKLNARSNSAYSDTRQLNSQIGELEETMLAKEPKTLEHLITTLAEEQDIKSQARTMYSIDALYLLARSLLAIPGRKNLIWITSGFNFEAQNGDMERLQRLTSQLAASQIAVYPIDARGVIVNEPDASTRDSEIFSMGGDITGGWIASLNEEQRSSYETLFDIAAQTGGRAFVNQNRFLPAISAVIDSGANYYTLSYRPTNGKWDGNFRKIQVKTPRKNVKLLYRTGYYALADPLKMPRLEDRERAMQIAMQPSAPPSTTLIIKTRVIPPPDGAKPVSLDYLVDVTDLITPDEPSKKKGIDVLFQAVAIDPQGRVRTSQAWIVKKSLSESELQDMRRRGLQIHEDLPLQAGDYQIRLGVLDRNSGKVGTVNVPLTIAQATPAK